MLVIHMFDCLMLGLPGPRYVANLLCWLGEAKARVLQLCSLEGMAAASSKFDESWTYTELRWTQIAMSVDRASINLLASWQPGHSGPFFSAWQQRKSESI